MRLMPVRRRHSQRVIRARGDPGARDTSEIIWGGAGRKRRQVAAREISFPLDGVGRRLHRELALRLAHREAVSRYLVALGETSRRTRGPAASDRVAVFLQQLSDAQDGGDVARHMGRDRPLGAQSGAELAADPATDLRDNSSHQADRPCVHVGHSLGDLPLSGLGWTRPVVVRSQARAADRRRCRRVRRAGGGADIHPASPARLPDESGRSSGSGAISARDAPVVGAVRFPAGEFPRV